MTENSHEVVSSTDSMSVDKYIPDIHVKEAIAYINDRIDEILERNGF